MGKNGRERRVVLVVVVVVVVLVLVLVLLMRSDLSNASFLSKLRELAAVARTASSIHAPLSQSPDPSQAESGGGGVGKTSNNRGSGTEAVGPPPRSQPGKEEVDKNQPPPTKEINKDERVVEAAPGENCTWASTTCTLQQSLMIACIFYVQPDVVSKTLVILVRNKGEGTLNVNLSAPNPGDDASLKIPKHRIFKVNLTAGNRNKVILRTEKEKCELEINPSVSQGNFFRFPSTDKLITPVNGAYFLILTVVVFGGSCACFRLRRTRHGGIPYQELEMGLAESSSTNNVVSEEGWDQDWDDDWDEENAVKSPAAQRTGSISANGLASRSPNKETRENDWDD